MSSTVTRWQNWAKNQTLLSWCWCLISDFLYQLYFHQQLLTSRDKAESSLDEIGSIETQGVLVIRHIWEWREPDFRVYLFSICKSTLICLSWVLTKEFTCYMILSTEFACFITQYIWHELDHRVYLFSIWKSTLIYLVGVWPEIFTCYRF